MIDLPRNVRAAEAAKLRGRGLTFRQVADRMGVSRSYAHELLTDPDGRLARVRKQRYSGVCEDCGGPTNGGEGRALAPPVCAVCLRVRRAPKHGTRSRYQAGCACDACREANRLGNTARRATGVAPNHGLSGYKNYGCRCDVCTAANTDYEWLHPEYRQRWLKRKRLADSARSVGRSAPKSPSTAPRPS